MPSPVFRFSTKIPSATMDEYRFSGVNSFGEQVTGTLVAKSKRAFKKKLASLAEKHRFTTRNVQKRHSYLYKVRHKNGTVSKGVQKAYAPKEVETAFQRLGMEVISVQKKIVGLSIKPAPSDIAMFVRLAANMLRRHLPFDEILTLLGTDTQSRSLRQAIKDLSSDLKGGMNGKQAFLKQQHIFGKFTSYMLGLSTNSGNMAEMFEATAKYLERKNEFRKQVRKTLIVPSVTLTAAIGVFVWFVWSLIPQMMGLFSNFDIEIPPFTKAALAFAAFLDNNGIWLVPFIVLLILSLVVFSGTQRGRFIIHRYMLKIPALGSLLHKLNLEIFCRVFGVLYSGSEENQEVMRVSAEATGNSYMEYKIKTTTMPLMMSRGTDLVGAMEASGVFLPLAIARFRSGTETGSVRASAEEMADFYEKETTLKLETTVETIKTAIAIVIGILVAILTIISTESALMMPHTGELYFQ